MHIIINKYNNNNNNNINNMFALYAHSNPKVAACAVFR